MEQDKKDYREYCAKNDSIPIFNTDWWLDQVCGEDNWDVSLVRQNNEIIGSQPYCLRKNFLGLNYITTPSLTTYLGPFITHQEKMSYSSRLAHEQKILHDLIKQLPRFSYFYQRFHYSITSWMPFYWDGFQQTTHFTNIIEDLTDLDSVFASFEKSKKANIRAGENTFTVETSDDIDEFYRINSLSFEKQGLAPHYSLDYVRGIDKECKKRGCRNIFFAKDSSDRIHCATYLIWDKMSSYCLMSGLDPTLKSSNSNPLLVWEEIKISSKVTKKFDFCGSMIPGVERFFRGFGATRMPYSIITKNFESPFIDLKNNLMTQLPYSPNIGRNLNSIVSKLSDKLHK